MRRLFWVGVGAVGAVVVAQRVRRAVRTLATEAVADRVEAAGQRTTTALHDAVGQFRTARAARERELVEALLVTPEGGDPDAVFRRRAAPPVDDDEPLYEF